MSFLREAKEKTGQVGEMKYKEVKIRYEYVFDEEGQRRLEEVFDMIFEKIVEEKPKEKEPLDRGILEDYNVFKCKNG